MDNFLLPVVISLKRYIGMNLTQTVLFIVPILLALTVHEYAHGWVAYKLGDPTAKAAGRLTFNPLSHLDVIGTVALLLFHFGWAKPVPVDPRYFRDPRRAMVWVAAAGPGANIALAFVLGILQRTLVESGIIGFYSIPHIIIGFTVFINLMLAFFNMLPIPPLDGSKVVAGLLPLQYLERWIQFERSGWIIIIGLFFIGSMTGIPVFKPIFHLARVLYWMFTGETSMF